MSQLSDSSMFMLFFYLDSLQKMRAVGGRESKACEEMEKKGFDQRPEEAQISTINHLFQILGDDSQNSWLNSLSVDGREEAYKEGRWFG